MEPRISVVVPSYNRRGSLLRLLGTLERQTVPPEQFEVIVVLDGSTDDSAAAAANGSWSFRLEIVEQRNAGPAAARNTGAARARGRLVAFLDDDIQLDPCALQEHMRSLDSHPGAIAIGRVECQWTHHGMGQRGEGYWRHFEEMADGDQLSFRDCYGCNVSMELSTFRSLEGFYEPMRRLEDVEFGFRAGMAEVPIIFAREAAGIHDVVKTSASTLNDAFHSGFATVLAWRNRPEFLAALSEGFRQPQAPWKSRLIDAVIAVPLPNRLAWWLGDLPSSRGIRTIHTMLWYRWYLRGARSATSSANEFRDFLGRTSVRG